MGRGIRPGCPLSPYIFILCTEVLSSIFYSYERANLFQGIRLNRYCPPISHLMFVDDVLIFGRVNSDSIMQVKNILQSFSSWSRQKINCEKSSILFSKLVTQNDCKSLASLMNLSSMKLDDKYLGLSTKTKIENFHI